jgi:RHS repeat-associated protein
MMSASPAGNYYIYSFDGKLLQVYDVYGALLKDFIYMGSRLIAEYDHVGARFLYYTPDQINSTRVVTDQSGNVVYSATYAPYGEIRTEQGTVDPLAKFSGKERDSESQLDYFGARYYDRNIYRFISVDPKIDFADSVHDSQRLNLYPYCGNKPIVFVDPDGLSHLEYYHLLGQVYLISGAGKIVGIFPAANNAGSNPYPDGTWPFDYFNGNYINNWPGIDNMGIYVFSVPGHTGMGFHAHEEESWELHIGEESFMFGGKSYKSASGGCITTTHAGMEAVAEMNKSDPVEFIYVERWLKPIVPQCMTTGLPFIYTRTIDTPLPPPGKDITGLGPGGI